MSKKKGGDGEKEVTPADNKMVMAILGPRNEEIQFIGWVQKEKSKNNYEPRLVVITEFRFFSFTPRGKIAREAHLLELEAITSPTAGEGEFTFKGWKIIAKSSNFDEIINTVRISFHASFSSFPPSEKFKEAVEPESRLVPLSDAEHSCGGFASTYKSLCNFYNSPVREDICWDVNNIYQVNSVTEFNFQEFEQPVSVAELAALIGALQHNTWFTSIVARDLPLDKKTFGDIAGTFKKNKTLSRAVFSNVGMTRDGLIQISDALSENKGNGINSIDVSQNSLDDKAMPAFSNCLSTLTHGMVNINISNNSFSKAGMQTFGGSLRKNAHMLSTLSVLDVSKNMLSAEGSSALASFLANPNTMRNLNVSYTDANLDTLLPAVIRGSSELQVLNIAGNKLSAKAVKTMTTFLQSCSSLKVLNVASTSITVDLLQQVTRAIGSNMYLQDFDFDASGNKLGSQGANVFAAISTDARNIVRLNIADNDFGDDGMTVLTAGLTSTSLKYLDISRNFSAKAKNRDVAIDNLINMICAENELETLVIKGSKANALRLDIAPFIYALATNDTLHRLDITGQMMGNKGAMALGKAMQINKTLAELRWDENGTTLTGFTSFRNGIARNRSLKDMQMPILDVATALKTDDPKKIQSVMGDIQDILSRNHAPKSMLGKGGAGSMFGQLNVMNSGEREQIERLSMKIKSTGRSLDEDQKKVIEDAENNDSTMSYLHLIAEEHQVGMQDEVTNKLKEMANDILPVVDNHYRQMVNHVMDTVRDKYKSLDSDTLRRLNTSVNFGAKELEAETVQNIMSSATAAEIQSKANDSFMSALEITTDYIFEKLAEALENIVEGVEKAPVEEHATVSEMTEEVEDDETDDQEVMEKSTENVAAPPRPGRPDRPDRPSRPPQKAAPPIPGGGRGRGKGRGGLNINPGLAAAIGGGLGGTPPKKPAPVVPEPEPASPAPVADSPSKKEDKKKKASKGGGLFGKKKKPPAPTPKKKSARPPSKKAVAATSAEIGNIQDAPTDVNTITNHMTKDRPMQRKRRPPTRRPRGPAAQ